MQNYIQALLLLISVGMNVFLAHRSYDLRVREAQRDSDERLAPGAMAFTIRARDADGNRITIPMKSTPNTSDPKIIYFMAENCSWCKRNENSFKSLSMQLAGRAELHAISADQQGGQLLEASKRLGIQVVGEPTHSTMLDYKLSVTPTTILVSSSGKVEKVWVGAYQKETKKDIEERFAIRLAEPDFSKR